MNVRYAENIKNINNI